MRHTNFDWFVQLYEHTNFLYFVVASARTKSTTDTSFGRKMCTCSQVTVQRSVSRTASTTRTSHQSSDHPPHAMAGLLRSLTSSLRHTRPLASQLFSSARSSTLPANFQVSRAAASRPFTATALARAEQEAAVTEEVQQQANTTDFVQYDEDPDQASTFQRYGEGAIYPPKRKGKDWVAQLHLKSFDKNQIQYACGYVKHLAALSGVQTGGAIPLPKRTLLVSLIRSPHVHKTSQEQVSCPLKPVPFEHAAPVSLRLTWGAPSAVPPNHLQAPHLLLRHSPGRAGEVLRHA